MTGVAAMVWADRTEPLRHYLGHLSLMHGWVPAAVQATAVVALGWAIGWRSPRWPQLWLPLMTAGDHLRPDGARVPVVW